MNQEENLKTDDDRKPSFVLGKQTVPMYEVQSNDCGINILA